MFTYEGNLQYGSHKFEFIWETESEFQFLLFLKKILNEVCPHDENGTQNVPVDTKLIAEKISQY